ncbi:MAG: enoyl-CoA hydratase/isomerase family protein [Nitrospinae bacterium]|nr:enoyl-CoA hydratase/isomerase family protein [Nitrospinota bacterium]
MNTHYLNLALEDSIGIITINNPPHNSLTQPLMEEFFQILNFLQKTEVKALIITGSSKCFCSGVDINELKKINSRLDAENLTIRGQDLLNRVENFHIPVLAAINGVCLGGGAELALSCHVRYCSDRAVFGFPELSLGIIPALGGTQRLHRAIGYGKAFELILTGNIVNAREAREIGLVEGVFPRDGLLREVKRIAKNISSKNPHAVRFVMESILSPVRKELSLQIRKDAHLNSIIFSQNTKSSD